MRQIAHSQIHHLSFEHTIVVKKVIVQSLSGYTMVQVQYTTAIWWVVLPIIKSLPTHVRVELGLWQLIILYDVVTYLNPGLLSGNGQNVCGGWVVVCKPILVFNFGFDQAEQLMIFGYCMFWSM